MKYTPTIGLEIHAELKTKTKMFCNSKNDPDEKRPNVNICPVCMAHPGTLPVINKEAVKSMIKIGMAVGGSIADFSEFDRKNYFYPDIPKGYQISQYKYPLVSGGSIKGVEITRIHLEEDTARSSHSAGDYSLVDFNRSGIPLMELVTEPVIHDAQTATAFAKELQLLLRYLGVAEANMEKGEMRVEANISVSPVEENTVLPLLLNSNGSTVLGTKVEVKNLNSFKVVEKAIEYEIKRQIEVLENGGMVEQETRGWNENTQHTFSQRKKEGAKDYRYFPDPDLPKLKISEMPEFTKEILEKEIPELPWDKRERYKKDFGIKDEDIESYVVDRNLGDFFEEVVGILGEDKEIIKTASNYITSDLMGLIRNNESGQISITIDPKDFADLIKMVKEGKISSRGAKDILVVMHKNGGSPQKIAEEKNLLQKSDEDELKKIVEKIIIDNPKVVEDYKNGKESALQFLVGQGMKETKGSANPEILKNLFKNFLI